MATQVDDHETRAASPQVLARAEHKTSPDVLPRWVCSVVVHTSASSGRSVGSLAGGELLQLLSQPSGDVEFATAHCRSDGLWKLTGAPLADAPVVRAMLPVGQLDTVNRTAPTLIPRLAATEAARCVIARQCGHVLLLCLMHELCRVRDRKKVAPLANGNGPRVGPSVPVTACSLHTSLDING